MGKAKFYLDYSVLEEKIIDISSSLPNAGVELETKALVDLLKPIVCDIISDKS